MFNIYHADGIKLLDLIFCEKVFSAQLKPKSKSIDFLQQFLLYAIENHDLQKINLNILDSLINHQDHQISSPTAAMILNSMIYSTRHSHNVSVLRLNQIYSHILSDMNLENNIKPQEIAIIMDISAGFCFLQRLYEDGWLNGNDQLLALYTKTHLSRHIANFFRENSTSFIQLLDNGAIIISKNGLDKSEILKESLTYFSKLAKYVDFSKIQTNAFEDLEDNAELSLNMLHSTAELEKKLFSDMCFISVDDLFTKDNQKILSQVYGKNWKEEILSMIKEIENQLLSKMLYHEKFKHEVSDKCAKIKSGFDLYTRKITASYRAKYELHKDHKMLMIKPKRRLIQAIVQLLEHNIQKDGSAIKCDMEKVLTPYL